MYVYQSVTFESLDVRHIFREWVEFLYGGYRVKEHKRGKSLFPQCKISIGHNSGST